MSDTRRDDTHRDDDADADAPTVPPREVLREGMPTRAADGESTRFDVDQLDGDSATAPTIKLDTDPGQPSLEEALAAHSAAAAAEGLDQTANLAPPDSSQGVDERTVYEQPPSSGVHAPTLLDGQTPRGSGQGDLRTVARLPSARSRSTGLRSSSLDHSDSLEEGAVYAGKYELQHEIARGGMGVVYKARQIDLNRIVALKVMLSGGMAGEEERRRFILEAEASARLKHPNIVPVYDIGEVAGNLYFTMDYVEGDPLSKRKQDLDPDALLDVMVKVADGVGFAHQRGIIHRDLKPANIMMDASNTPLIMDFGLAKQVDITDEQGQPSLRTREGAVMGTPHYMPPEQADGRISEIDVRSDVWALGVILYELYTGELPFVARSLTELLFKIYEQDPKPPRQIDPSVDWDMEAIILKALEKDKAARYQTAYDLKADLENVQRGLPVSARRATVIYRARKWARRNRAPLLVGALLLAMASVTAGVLYRQSQASFREAQLAFEQSLDEARSAAASLRADGDDLREKLGALAGVEGLDERRQRVEALASRAAELQTRLNAARGLLQPHLDERPSARELDSGALAKEEVRQAGWRETLDSLRDVHGQLAKARTALDEALGLAKAVEAEYAKGGGEAEEASWTTLRDGLKELQREETQSAPQTAGASPSRKAFDDAAGRARQHLFAAVSLSDPAWPEGARAREGVETEARLRARVDGAAQRASRLRLAARMLFYGKRLLALLEQRPEGRLDESAQTERLRAARMAQALIQRGREAHTSDELTEAGFDANKAYATELLAMKAYLVFDAELDAQGAFRPLDLRDLLAAKEQAQRGTKALRAVLEGHGAKLTASLDQAALDAMLRSLLELEDDPALDVELGALRRDLLARAQSKRDELVREVAQREIAAALKAARSKTAEAAGDPERLPDLVATWQTARALCEKHRQLLGATITDATVRTCGVAQAKLHHDAALTLERRDPARALPLAERADTLYAPYGGDAEVDAQLSAIRELVTRLQRISAKPEGMVLIAGRRDVELGSGPLDRNPVRRASLAPFYLAEKEVTCAEYARFLVSARYTDAAFWRRIGVDSAAVQRWPEGWTSASPPEGAENLPVTGISWPEARGYARFVGMRLPRDDEWEFAARYHGASRTAFPWGDAFAEGKLRNVLRPPGDNPADATAEGVFDMGGNVSEWVVRQGESGEEPAARGASFLYPSQRIASGAHRLLPRPDYRGPQLGLRLAKDSQ